MKNFTKLFGTRGKSLGVILCAAFVALAFIGCSDSGSSALATPVVTGVTLSPEGAIVVLTESGTLNVTFTATVNGTGSPSQDVTWLITPTPSPGTTFENGALVVGTGDTTTSYVVTATSVANTLYFKTATVKIYADPTNVPVVTDVTISPSGASDVIKGSTVQFGAQVYGSNGHSQNVIWSIVESGTSSSIDANGKLSVASGETLNKLTVRATAEDDVSQYDEVDVTLVTPAAPSTDLNGIWTGDLTSMGLSGQGEWDMSNGTFTLYQGSGDARKGMFRGTYQTAGTRLISTITGINGLVLNSKMPNEESVTLFGFKDQFYTMAVIENTVRGKLAETGMPQEQIDLAWESGFENFAGMVEPQTSSYVLGKANTELTIIVTGRGPIVLTKTGSDPNAAPNADLLVGTWNLDVDEYTSEDFGAITSLELSANDSFVAIARVTEISGGGPFRLVGGIYATEGNQFTMTPEFVIGSGVNGVIEAALTNRDMLEAMFAEEGGSGNDEQMTQMINMFVNQKAQFLLENNKNYDKTELEDALKERIKKGAELMGQTMSADQVNETYDEEVAPYLEQMFTPRTATYWVSETALTFSYDEMGDDAPDVTFKKQ